MLLMNDVEVVEFLERKYIEKHILANNSGKRVFGYKVNAKYERNLELFKDYFSIMDIHCNYQYDSKAIKELSKKYNIGDSAVKDCIMYMMVKFRNLCYENGIKNRP